MALVDKTEDAMLQGFCGGDADTTITREIQNARKMILLKSKKLSKISSILCIYFYIL